MKILAILLVLMTSFVNAAVIERVDTNTITYTGYVVKGDALDLYTTLKDNDTIVVKSFGGDAFEGIALFRAISRFDNITIKVDGHCASACANFSLAADNIDGELLFHNAFINGVSDINLKNLAGTMVSEANYKIEKEIWSGNLTEAQIQNIKEKSNPNTFVSITK